MRDLSTLNKLNLEDIVGVDFPDNQYHKSFVEKIQACLHHTVSNPFDTSGDFRTWLETAVRIATFMIIDGYGTPYQCFWSGYWGWHLGVGGYELNSKSLAIELDSWGGLILGDGNTKVFGNKKVLTERGRFYNAYGHPINVNDEYREIVHYPMGFRGYEYYGAYTDAQLERLYQVLKFVCDRYPIEKGYKGEEMWDVSSKALSGESGIWTHVSYNKDKSDCHPQDQLIEVLEAI